MNVYIFERRLIPSRTKNTQGVDYFVQNNAFSSLEEEYKAIAKLFIDSDSINVTKLGEYLGEKLVQIFFIIPIISFSSFSFFTRNKTERREIFRF